MLNSMRASKNSALSLHTSAICCNSAFRHQPSDFVKTSSFIRLLHLTSYILHQDTPTSYIIHHPSIDCYFDDMYSPEYTIQWIYDAILNQCHYEPTRKPCCILLDSIDRLSMQVVCLTADNKELQHQIDELLKQI